MKNIIIVGGGSAGYIAASLFSKELKDYHITMVVPSDIPNIGVGESTIPSFVEFINRLGIPEEKWLRDTKGVYKYGIDFQNWYKKDTFWWHGFDTDLIKGDILAPWFNSFDINEDPNDIFKRLTNTFDLYKNKKEPIANFPNLTYAYHLNADDLVNTLDDFILKNGVTKIVGEVIHLEKNNNNDITSVRLKSGQIITGDIFVDCTGFRRVLMNTYDIKFNSLSDKLTNNSAVFGPVHYQNKEQEITPGTISTAMDAGWRWRIDLWDRIGTGYVYDNNFISDDEACYEFRKSWDFRIKEKDCNKLNFNPGYLDQVSTNNVFSLGLASGFIEPLEATALWVFFQQAQHISKIVTEGRSFKIYNKVVKWLYKYLSDFVYGHYMFTERRDTPYWEYTYNKAQSVNTKEILWNNYEQSLKGMGMDPNRVMFPTESWAALALGYNQRAPLKSSDKEINEFLNVINKKQKRLDDVIDDTMSVYSKLYKIHGGG